MHATNGHRPYESVHTSAHTDVGHRTAIFWPSLLHKEAKNNEANIMKM